MRSLRAIAWILVAIVLAVSIGACGDDEDSSGDSASAPQTEATSATTSTTTTGTQTSAGDPEDNPRVKELTSCLEGQKLNVIVNSGIEVDADFQLVIDAGSGGVLYGFADTGVARSAKGSVKESQGSAGRDVEVRADTVFAFSPNGHTLTQPAKYKKVRACIDR